jgi:predicted transposase/invertase (TIGR01784 family)
LDQGGVTVEEKSGVSVRKPHDEAFKKLIQEFFIEFLALFFPQLHAQLDRNHTSFLMQELLVDVVGGERKTLDLLIETKLISGDVNVLVHLEPQSSHQADFATRMFVYFSRLFELHRLKMGAIIPIAVFTHTQLQEEVDTLEMGLPGMDILRFRFLKLQLRKQHWRRFVESDNPVAAAMLAQMDVGQDERVKLRKAFWLMMIRLRRKLNEAQLELISSYADLYYEPKIEEEEALLREIAQDQPEEGAVLMELMPAWKRWGYEEGIEKGIERGIEQGFERGIERGIEQGFERGIERGIEQGIERGIERGIEQGLETGKRSIALNLLTKGMSVGEVCEVTKLSLEVVRELRKSIQQ